MNTTVQPSATVTGDVRVEPRDPVRLTDTGADTAALAEIVNASSSVDSPHEALVSPRQLRLRTQYGWEGPAMDSLFVAVRGETPVGYVGVWFAHWDNPTVAALDLLVHPDARGDDLVADELFASAVEACRAGDRTSVVADAWRGSWLADYWERNGFPVAMQAAQRRLAVDDVDREVLSRMRVEAERASPDYDVEVLAFPTPPPLAEPMLDLRRAMNDAPLDDLDLEDDTWSLERLAAFESACVARDERRYVIVARRRRDGVLGGFTECMVDPGAPHAGHQGDTGVVGVHRGHRLGLRLKVAMLDLLAEVEPQLQTIDTWNAESNAHMIAVNQLLGCYVVARGQMVQREVA